MSFDKEAYWENRAAKQRGQGDKPVTSRLIDISYGQNRSQRHRKFVDRHFTKKGYTRVIHVSDDGKTHTVEAVKLGHYKHRIAVHNIKKAQRDRRLALRGQ